MLLDYLRDLLSCYSFSFMVSKGCSLTSKQVNKLRGSNLTKNETKIEPKPIAMQIKCWVKVSGETFNASPPN